MLRIMHGYEGIGGAATDVARWLTAMGYTVSGVSGSNLSVVDTSVDVEGMAIAGRALRLQLGAAAPELLLPLGTAEQQLVVGFTFSADSWCRICRMCGVDVLWSSDDGRLHVGDAIGADVLIRGPRWQVDVEVDYDEGIMRVYAQDRLQLEADVDLATERTAAWGGAASGTAVMFDLDDVYVVDNAAGGRTERLGGRLIVAAPPKADVTAQWNAMPPLTLPGNWQVVSQTLTVATPAATLRSNTPGATDIYDVGVALPGEPEIYAVQLLAYARKGDLDDRRLGLLLQAPGGEPEITSMPLGTEYQFFSRLRETMPGDQPLDAAAVETLQAGIVME